MSHSKIFLTRIGALFALALACAGAHAATITVNTTSEVIAADGQCSIREAVANANDNTSTYADCAAGSGADSIVFDATVFATPQTIVLTRNNGGNLTLTDTAQTTIDGAGKVTLDGNRNVSSNSTQILFVASGASAQLTRLTLQNGHCNSCSGGAVGSQGTLSLTGTTLSGNLADGNGGGIFNDGGTLNLANSTVRGNFASAGRGGGIYSQNGTLSLIDSTVSGNQSNNNGGGIDSEFGTLSVTNSTVSGNQMATSAGRGAGISNYYGTLSLVSSTVVGNNAAPNAGGAGVYSEGAPTATTIIASTIPDNDVYTVSFSGAYAESKIIGSFIKNLVGFTTTDSYGNLIGNVANANLWGLADNGGPTQTMLPMPTSAFLNAVDCTDMPATDQRGVKRGQGPYCDIGAVDVEPATDSIFANGFEPASFCSGGLPGSRVVFVDTFSSIGGGLDGSRWYGNNTSNGNGGTVGVNNGVATASSSSYQFPFVEMASALPQNGPFSVRWRSQYTNIAANGTGMVISKGFPVNGTADDYALRRADVWQDSANGFQVRARTTDAGIYGPLLTLAASATTPHDVEYCWLDNTVEIWADGSLLSSTSNAGLTRPDSFWFGNPVTRGVTGQPWTSFSLDYVRVRAMVP